MNVVILGVIIKTVAVFGLLWGCGSCCVKWRGSGPCIGSCGNWFWRLRNSQGRHASICAG